jgi:hypothetical protein
LVPVAHEFFLTLVSGFAGSESKPVAPEWPITIIDAGHVEDSVALGAGLSEVGACEAGEHPAKTRLATAARPMIRGNREGI